MCSQTNFLGDLVIQQYFAERDIYSHKITTWNRLLIFFILLIHIKVDKGKGGDGSSKILLICTKVDKGKGGGPLKWIFFFKYVNNINFEKLIREGGLHIYKKWIIVSHFHYPVVIFQNHTKKKLINPWFVFILGTCLKFLTHFLKQNVKPEILSVHENQNSKSLLGGHRGLTSAQNCSHPCAAKDCRVIL